jgi:hypothetical protein
MSQNSSILYKDAGCPSQCNIEKYSSIAGKTACSNKCSSVYANPYSEAQCPSYCNFYDTYTTVSNMYSSNTMYIPPNSAARIYHYPIGINADYMVTQPQIVNFSGQSKMNNLSGQPLLNDPSSIESAMANNLSMMGSKLVELKQLQSQMVALSENFKRATTNQKVDLVAQGKRIAERSNTLFTEVSNANNEIVTLAINIAPFTVRDDARNTVVDNTRKQAQMITKEAQAINNQMIILQDLSAQRTAQLQQEVQAGVPAPTNLSAEPFRYRRRYGPINP